MLNKLIKLLGGLVVVAVLAACGGGGGSPGANGNGSNGGGGGAASSTLSSLELSLDKNTIVNSGNDFAELTVTALDANRGVMAGVPVQVSLSPDGIFQRISAETVTNADGRFVGRILIGSNKEDRVLSVRVSSGSVVRLVSVQVRGTQIQVTPLPATPTPGQTTTLNITVRDSAGQAIPGVRLSLGGSFGATGEVTTNPSGEVVSSIAAPSTAGSYSLVVSGNGVSASQSIVVGSPRPPAIGPIVSAGLTPEPSQIRTNSVGSSANRSVLVARFLTTGNTPIENMRVRFEIVPPALGAGEFISTGSSLVFSNSSGVAESAYVAGTRSSPTDGVRLRICYDLNDFAASACPNERLSNLTVAGNPVSITIGENNELQKGLGNLTYIRQHIIQVVDSAGVAVNDAVVSVSVDITHYGKGPVWNQLYQGFTALQAPTIRDIHSDYDPDPRPAGALQTLQSSNALPTTRNFWCINEDQDRNGSLTTAEDVNGNGRIDPPKADVAVAFPSGNRTNAQGQLVVTTIFPQNVGRWLAYTIRATTGVQGSEGDVSKAYVTEVVAGDVQNGSFLTPAYGAGSCRQPN